MYDRIVNSWNIQADKYNQWSELGEDEKIEYAVKYTAMCCREISQQRFLATDQAVKIDEKISDEFGV